MTEEQLKRIEEVQAEYDKMGYDTDVKSRIEEKMATYDVSFDYAFDKMFCALQGTVRPVRRKNDE